MSRVLVVDPYYPLPRVRELLAGLGVAVEEAEAPWAGDDVVALLTGPDQPVGTDELARLPALRVVASCSVGFDHIDLQACSARGVRVCNVPDYCVDEMADSALAFVLALLRGVVALDRHVREGGWDYTTAGVLRRFRGTRLGVVGYGRIGRALAGRALALGFDVTAHDSLVGADAIERTGARAASLHDLLSSSDAVSLHVPLTPETDGLIGAAELGLLPRGAVLINTARARLVDEAALLAALESGRLGGAALDVLPVEPPPGPPPAHPRLVITPHSAWYSAEAEEAVYRRAVESVRAVLEGSEPGGALA